MSARNREDHTGRDAQYMVGEYIVGQRIGQGSFATVYKGQHKDTRKYVAVKSVLRSRLTPKLLENLESEIKILKGIRHNHIVELVDCQKTESHIHLIMEFCSLGDLSAYIKRRKAAPSGQGPAGGLYEIVSRHFLKQLASALEFLRSKNLIHRDIKPQNLLLLPPNTNQSGRPVIGLPNYPTLKIADFGFARSLPSHSLAETLCGSPLYMAPEILRYEKYDAKADLWSVGAVLYEMVTGRPPFRALNHVELLHKIEKGGDNIRFPGEPSWSSKNRDDGYDIDIPTTSVPLVSDDMKDVIRHLLKRNPVERISFEEFFYHPAVTTDLENISAAAAARVVVDDGLTVVPLSAQLSLPQPPAQTISTPARRATDRYEPPPFAQQDSKPASSPREQRKQPLLKRQEDLGFANMQYEKQGNRPASEGAKRSPLPPQGVVSRNTVGMQRNVEKEALVENRQTNNVQSDHYRAHDPLVSRPTTRVRPIRSNSFDVNSPPNSILIQRPGDFIAADEAEQREREIPGLPRRRGSVGGTGTESLREFYRGTASTTAEDDVMIEREYVVVDKGAVEVNELADQLAASPVNNMIVARTRSPFRQNSTSSGLLAHSPSPPFISPYSNHSSTSPPGIAASHYYGTTPPFAIPGSTTTQQDRAWNGTPSSGGNSGGSALAKAISAASMRLLGPGNSPPSRGEKYLYNRRGSSGSTSSGNAIVVFGGGGDDPEEDAIIKTIEDAACKAHAVEQLAQAKYDMIAPPPPAAAEALLQFDATQDKSKIADEAFVLYLKTLALLQSGLDVAKEHWSKQRAGLANNVQPKAASVRLNEAVQWMRDHFNECLEKAEFVKSKASTDEEGNDTLVVKLIYERALDISRKAAVTELLGDDLAGCEHSYQMAIWMLEAILDTRSRLENEEGMDDEDRRVVKSFIGSITNRLNALRKKIELATAVISGSPNS